MKKAGIVLIVLSIVMLILCIWMTSISFDKYENYYNGSYSTRNAYVGGDAYNYIINGTYFTAFAVYAVGCGISAILCFASGAFLICFNKVIEENDENRLSSRKLKQDRFHTIQKTLTEIHEEEIREHQIVNDIYSLLTSQKEAEESNQNDREEKNVRSTQGRRSRTARITSIQPDSESSSDTPDRQ